VCDRNSRRGASTHVRIDLKKIVEMGGVARSCENGEFYKLLRVFCSGCV